MVDELRDSNKTLLMIFWQQSKAIDLEGVQFLIQFVESSVQLEEQILKMKALVQYLQ